ncbi:hypothetical protein FE236_02185 [Mariprofundus erugo]|uniref:hypothetical protein n=1 Tax=Mariprofundus erugo TaxID=2528639 RepID=UPI0010FE446F|nr:hypothetical protein [Mariprofundus erugo]TLS77931.1 hypothetical protein FE236_02185 [Mariprofundus erugo]
MYSLVLDNGDIAKHAAYIYAIYAEGFRALYVGQTFSRSGALGRLSQHLSDTSSNTFKQRLCAQFGYATVKVGAVRFFAFKLSEEHESFYLESRDYREAVEMLVQCKVLSELSSRKKNVVVVSRVSSNAYTRLKYIQDEADLVSVAMVDWLGK